MSRKAQTPEAPEQATAQKETTAPAQAAPEQPEAKAETQMPAGTRVAAQRSEAFAASNASDPECRAGRATEGYPLLEDIAALAVRHRVAAWEQAALARMMGWADGKMVTDAAYQAALAKLHGRRLGGGRMA